MGSIKNSIVFSFVLFASLQASADCAVLETSLGQVSTVVLANVPAEAVSAKVTGSLSAVDADRLVEVAVEVSGAGAQARIAAPYSSPSFSSRTIDFEWLDAKGTAVGGGCLKASVAAVLEIRFNTDDEDITYFDSPKEMYLRPHAQGLLVKFINLDGSGSEHRVHAEGAIPHSPSSAILKAVGDSYEHLVQDTQEVQARYYCHNHDSSADQHRLNFNVSDASRLSERLFALPADTLF